MTMGLELRRLSAGYPRRPVLQGLDLEPIAPGAKRLPSSLVQITTSTGRSVTTRASLSAFRHASPAITP